MAGLLNRPLAGTLMGAVASQEAAKERVVLPEQYFRSDPGVSLTPSNKTTINIGNSAGQYPAGPYILRVPTGVKGMRARMFGAQGSNNNGSSTTTPSGGWGGRLVGDFATQPGALMLVILGHQVSVTPENFRSFSIEYGGAAPLGGGFSAIWRLSQANIDEFAIMPPQDPAALMSSYVMNRDKVPAIVEKAKLLMLVGAGGSSGSNGSGAAQTVRGGYPTGEPSPSSSSGSTGRGGSQTAGGLGGSGSTAGVAGGKFFGGSPRRGLGAGGSGFYGGGSGADDTNQSVTVGNGGGGSSYFDADEVFYADAPVFGPGTDTDSDRPNYTTAGPGVPGRIVLLWD